MTAFLWIVFIFVYLILGIATMVGALDDDPTANNNGDLFWLFIIFGPPLLLGYLLYVHVISKWMPKE